MKVTISAKDNTQVKGDVLIQLKRGTDIGSLWGEGSKTQYLLSIPYNGVLELPKLRFENVAYLTVWPNTDHLSEKISEIKAHTKIELQSMPPSFFHLWREQIGCSNSSNRGLGIRVANIDARFDGDTTLERVRVRSPDGKPASASGGKPGSPVCHGTDVSRIIAADSEDDMLACGIAPKATLTVFLVEKPRGGDRIPTGRVLEIIERIIVKSDCHIINLSLGRHTDHLKSGEATAFEKQWEDTAKLAEHYGKIIVAAAGNTPGASVCVPARCKTVVGVGGIGFAGLARMNTVVGLSENSARSSDRPNKSCFGSISGGRKVFANVDHSNGHGMDCCAPSVGFSMRRGDRSAVEFYGTSFAAPVVSGLLAARLSDEGGLEDLSGSMRSKKIRSVFDTLLTDLGLNSDYQGRGMVRIPTSCSAVCV